MLFKMMRSIVIFKQFNLNRLIVTVETVVVVLVHCNTYYVFFKFTFLHDFGQMPNAIYFVFKCLSIE
jgi:hypothetical protein